MLSIILDLSMHDGLMSFVWCRKRGKLHSDKLWHLVGASVSQCNQIQAVTDIKPDINFLSEFPANETQWQSSSVWLCAVIKTEM